MLFSLFKKLSESILIPHKDCCVNSRTQEFEPSYWLWNYIKFDILCGKSDFVFDNHFFEVYPDKLLFLFCFRASDPPSSTIWANEVNSREKKKVWILDIFGTVTVFLLQNTIKLNSTLQGISAMFIALLIGSQNLDN